MNNNTELNTKDIRIVAIILLVSVAAVLFVLLWAQRTIAAEPGFPKATGITLHGCKSVTVYMAIEGGHILAPIWSQKSMQIPVANPVVCDYKGQVEFYVLPSRNYRIEVKQEAK